MKELNAFVEYIGDWVVIAIFVAFFWALIMGMGKDLRKGPAPKE